MSINENLTEFQGKTVKDFDADKPLDDPQKVVYRIRLDYEEGDAGTRWTDKLAQLLETKGSNLIESLIVGAWEEVGSGTDSASIVEARSPRARDRLPKLAHLFFGDIIVEESEISWIGQTDLSPIFEAYPELRHITIRGGEGLSLGHMRHERLRELIIQTGGLPPSVIHEITASYLPSLEHLELWLGEPNYGGDATGEDLAPILRGDKFPKLKYLGIKDSVIADELIGIIVNSPLFKRLDVLDVSMGTLSDDGVKALIASPEVRRLKKLDLHHHFVSDEMVAKLDSLGIEVDASDKQEPHEWGGEQHRFIAVSE